MKAIWIVWTGLNVLFAQWLAFISLWSFFIQSILRPLRIINKEPFRFLLIGILAFAHTFIAFAIGYFFSLGFAVMCSSILFLHWALVAYFFKQRFAIPLKRTMMVIRRPFLLLIFLFLAIISVIIALALFAAWYWAPAIILVWFLYGYICAEYAIRSHMRKTGAERVIAIMVINEAQDRMMFLMGDRYPFP